MIVLADSWYEWIAAAEKKQPYLLRARDRKPLFLIALTNVKAGEAGGVGEGEGVVDGVVTVTEASDSGAVDVHDRRPVALNADDARLWLDPDTTVELAAELARIGCRPVENFEWYPVSREVNRIGNDSAYLIEPIQTKVHTHIGDGLALPAECSKDGVCHVRRFFGFLKTRADRVVH